MRIAIIDDEREMLSMIREIMEKAVEQYDDVELFGFREEEKLLFQAREGEQYDILVSDIELTNMNGIELAKKMRKELPHIYLIFLTSFTEYAIKSYEIDAHQYILKQNMEERLPYVLIRLIDKIKREMKQFKMIGTSKDMEKIYFKDIISIKKEKSAKYVCYNTENSELRVRTTLDKVVKELNSKEFLLVERGYMINMNHIIKIRNSVIYLTNKEEITISKSRHSKVVEAVTLFMRDL